MKELVQDPPFVYDRTVFINPEAWEACHLLERRPPLLPEAKVSLTATARDNIAPSIPLYRGTIPPSSIRQIFFVC